jgi:hypothetical protein
VTGPGVQPALRIVRPTGAARHRAPEYCTVSINALFPEEIRGLAGQLAHYYEEKQQFDEEEHVRALTQFRFQIQEKDDVIEELTVQAAEKVALVKTQEAEIAILKEQLLKAANKRTEYEALEKEKKELRKSWEIELQARIKQEVDKIQINNQETVKQLKATHQTVLQSKDVKIQELENEKTTLQRSLEKERKTLQQNGQKSEKQKKSFEQEVEGLRGKLQKKDVDLLVAQSTIDNLQLQIRNFKKQHEDEMAAPQKQIEDLKRELDSVKAAFGKFLTKYKDLEDKCSLKEQANEVFQFSLMTMLYDATVRYQNFKKQFFETIKDFNKVKANMMKDRDFNVSMLYHFSEELMNQLQKLEEKFDTQILTKQKIEVLENKTVRITTSNPDEKAIALAKLTTKQLNNFYKSLREGGPEIQELLKKVDKMALTVLCEDEQAAGAAGPAGAAGEALSAFLHDFSDFLE